jgi:hypothetical protein
MTLFRSRPRLHHLLRPAALRFRSSHAHLARHLQRIREVTYAAGPIAGHHRWPRTQAASSSPPFTGLRARLGLADDATCPSAWPMPDTRAHFPADVYNAARILSRCWPRRRLFIPVAALLDDRASRCRLHHAQHDAHRLVKRRREKIRRASPTPSICWSSASTPASASTRRCCASGRSWASAIPRSPKSCCRSTASSAPASRASRPGPTWPSAANWPTSTPSPACCCRPSASALPSPAPSALRRHHPPEAPSARRRDGRQRPPSRSSFRWCSSSSPACSSCCSARDTHIMRGMTISSVSIWAVGGR